MGKDIVVGLILARVVVLPGAALLFLMAIAGLLFGWAGATVVVVGAAIWLGALMVWFCD